MNKYKVSDYQIFESAKKSTTDYKIKIEEVQKKINDAKDALQTGDIFEGPICEAYTHKLEVVSNKLDTIMANCDEIINFIGKTSESYQSADNKASSDVKLENGNSTEEPKEYRLQLKNKRLVTTEYTGPDMSNYPTGNSREDGIERAALVAQYLVEHGGFTKEQAAGIVGVYVDENNCDPTTYNVEEKNGQGVAGTGGNGYGAGIGSWTFESTKQQILKDAGLPADTLIENLSLEDQSKLVIASSQGEFKRYYDAIKRCDTIEDASASAVVLTGGVGMSNNWDTHPTQAEAHEVSEMYRRSNDALFGVSEYHGDLDVRRLDYAKKVYEKMQ